MFRGKILAVVLNPVFDVGPFQRISDMLSISKKERVTLGEVDTNVELDGDGRRQKKGEATLYGFRDGARIKVIIAVANSRLALWSRN